MNIFRYRDIRIMLILLTSAFLVTWMLPVGMLFAQDSEEDQLLEELTGEEADTGEEGNIEVLGFTEEDAAILNNKLLISIIALVVAAVGGLFLSFIIRGRV